MTFESNYIVNVQVRNLSFHSDGYKKEAIELHRHHFDNFQDAFACLLSFDEKDFFEKHAVRNRQNICLESIDVDVHSSSDADKPTIVSAMRGGDSPLINEPPGMYYILWNGADNFCKEYKVPLDQFANYDASRMLLPIAHFNTKKVEVITDPAYQQLKHQLLRKYLCQKRFCLSTFSIASHFEGPSVYNFSGLMIDAWHFDSVQAAMKGLAELNLQKFDLGYTSLHRENHYYQGIKLYEERGEQILSLTTNMYQESDRIPKGIYLHWNQDSPIGEGLRKQWSPHNNQSSVLLAKYSSEFQLQEFSEHWKALKSVDFAVPESDVAKRQSRGASKVINQFTRQQNKLR